MEKSRPTFKYENKHRLRGCARIAGVDEAGRGPLAGPVVAAAVVFPFQVDLTGLEELNDSKKLTEKKRNKLFEVLMSRSDIEKGVGIVDSTEIDRINILRATHVAMTKAVEALLLLPEVTLIDGLWARGFPYPQENIVKGDAQSLSIAAASVIAKVTRDRLMDAYALTYPEYGFERHAGYGTKQHLAALQKYGPCPIHRLTFSPVAQASLPLFG